MPDYFGLLGRSWSLFKKNPALILPLLIGFLLGLGFIVFAAIQFLLIFTTAIFTYSASEILAKLISIWPLFLALAIADLFVLLLIISYVRAMQIGAYRDVMLNKKITAEKILSYGAQYFGKYFAINLIRALLYLPAIIIIALFIAKVFAMIYGLRILEGTSVFILLPLFLVALLYLMAVYFLLYFLDPIFSRTKLSPWETIKSSMGYTRNNLGHVLLTWLVMLLASLAASFVFFIMMLPVEALHTTPLYLSARAVFEVAQYALSALLGVVLDLFLFSCYFGSPFSFEKRKSAFTPKKKTS